MPTKDFNTTMGVGEFCGSCKYSAIFTILAKINQIEKEKGDDFIIQKITGKLLHVLFQKTFINDFDKIIFQIKRLGFEKKEAVKKILSENLTEMGRYLTYVEYTANDKNYYTILENQSANVIAEAMFEHLDILSDISTEMIQKDENGEYYCTLIDNELRISKELNGKIFLKGKIDSLIINKYKEKNEIKIIDVKTGASKSNSHSKQIKIYADLLNDEISKKTLKPQEKRKNLAFKIKPELWYTNPNLKTTSSNTTSKRHIKNPRWKENKQEELKKILQIIKITYSVTIEKARNFRNEKWNENFINCKFCGNLCRFIEEFNLPSEKDLSKHNGTLSSWLNRN